MLSIVNTQLRDGKALSDIAFDLGFNEENLVEHLAVEGYVYDQQSLQFKR